MADTDFWQALSNTIHRSVNLRVVTLVGDPGITGTLEQLEVSAPKNASGTIVTDINLVGGDVTCMISDRLLTADFADLRNAHQESVKQAQEIVARNIAVLVSVAKDLGDRLHVLPAPSAGPVRGATTVAPPAAPAG